MLTAAFHLYARVPVLFIAFAAIVVIPYELIVLAITGDGPINTFHLGFLPRQELLVADSFIVTPLISALHVRAIRRLGDGGTPTFKDTFRRNVPRLPVVAVAAGISGVLIGLGSIVVIPGILFLVIWPVVAQAAALEDGGPIAALRRSFDLTRGNRWHGFWLVFCAGLIAGIPGTVLFFIFRHTGTTAGTFVLGTAVQVLVRSFEALATGLLYFDLLARERGEIPGLPTIPPLRRGALTAIDAPVTPPTGHPADPASWSDDDRPAGWYINPAQPKRMRYWSTNGPGTGVWSGQSTKTPTRVRETWERIVAEDRTPD